MKTGDTVWVPHPGLGGGPMHAREWRVTYVDGRVGLRYGSRYSSCAPEDAYPSREACEAAIALRAASEAVAKARDEVVARAGAWYEAKHTIVASATAGALEDAVAALYEAEDAEAEARAKLEALR